MSKNELPAGWKILPLKQVCVSIESGTWGNEPTENNSYPILRSNNIQEGKLNLNDIAFRSVSKKDFDTKTLEDGDIIVTKSSGSSNLIGKNAIFYKFDETTYLFANFLERLKPDKRIINPKYLYYFLNSPFAKQVIVNMHNTTSGLRNLNLKMYKEQPVLLPSLPEQERIVSKLDRQMAQIEMMKKEAEKQEDALCSLFLSYISEKFDENFPTEMLGSLVNEIKNGVYKPSSFRGKGHKLVRMYNIENDSIELNDDSLELIELTNDELEKYTLQKGDVLISRVNSAELVGKCGVVRDKLVGYAYENMVMRVRVNPFKIIPDYLAYFLISLGGKSEIRSRAKHAINQSSINNKDVSSIPVPLPPTIGIQKEIVKDLDSKFEYIEGLKNQIKIELNAIDCLKSSFLNEVFGKYEIPDEA